MVLMHLITIVIAVVILVVGVYVGKNQNFENSNISRQEKVLSEEDKIPENLEEPTITPTSDISSEADRLITTPSVQDGQVRERNAYKYPNSTIMTSSDTSLTLQSHDSTDTITDWYKERIKSEGLNVKTFVNTRANDKVLNKLVAADSNKEISVEINKEPGSSVVEISVTRESGN